jgi:hypothetical protein
MLRTSSGTLSPPSNCAEQLAALGDAPRAARQRVAQAGQVRHAAGSVAQACGFGRQRVFLLAAVDHADQCHDGVDTGLARTDEGGETAPRAEDLDRQLVDEAQFRRARRGGNRIGQARQLVAPILGPAQVFDQHGEDHALAVGLVGPGLDDGAESAGAERRALGRVRQLVQRDLRLVDHAVEPLDAVRRRRRAGPRALDHMTLHRALDQVARVVERARLWPVVQQLDHRQLALVELGGEHMMDRHPRFRLVQVGADAATSLVLLLRVRRRCGSRIADRLGLVDRALGEGVGGGIEPAPHHARGMDSGLLGDQHRAGDRHIMVIKHLRQAPPAILADMHLETVGRAHSAESLIHCVNNATVGLNQPLPEPVGGLDRESKILTH